MKMTMALRKRCMFPNLIMYVVWLTLGQADPAPVNITRPQRLVYASWRPEFYRMALQSTIPAWIDSAGSLMIPKTVYQPQELEKNSYGDVYSSYKVAIPGLDNLFNPEPRLAAGVDTINDNDAYRQLVSPYHCTECSGGLIFPSLTYPDGSDIFVYDIFEPSEDVSEWREVEPPTAAPVPIGCFYPKRGYLVCNQKDLTVVPDLPKQLIAFQMNETNVQSIQSSDFNGTKVLIMKLDFNAISSVMDGAFTGTQGLAKLSMENNLISSFQSSMFIGLQSLQVLSLKANRIDWSHDGKDRIMDHDINYLPRLAYLNMANNPLGSLNQHIFWIFRNSPIEELNLQSCNLSYIHPDAFEPLKKLIHLDLFNNGKLIPELNAMHASHLTGLQKLGLAGNLDIRLERLPIEFIERFNSTLIQLNLSGNLFPTLSSSILAFRMPQLTALILNDCFINTVESGALTGVPGLAAVYLARNNLKELASSAMPPLLQKLSIRENPTQHGIVTDTFTLRVDACGDLANLKWLDMNFVNLEVVGAESLCGMAGLNYLQVREANIRQIHQGSFDQLGQLVFLDLGQNPIGKLPANFSRGLAKLSTLFLDDCSLSLSPCDPSPFQRLLNLQNLYLNNNKAMEDLDPSLLRSLTRLIVLNLSSNQLKNWQPGTTQFMSSQTNIDLSYNQMTSLPDDVLAEFGHINAIDLSHNNFFCSCDVAKLNQLVGLDTQVTLLNWEDPASYRCANLSDPRRPRINIADLNEDSLNCNSPPTPWPVPDREARIVAPVVVSAALLIAVCVLAYFMRDEIRRKWHLFRDRVIIESSTTPGQSKTYHYDAFVSFNERDRDWVYTYLVPQLDTTTPTRNGIMPDADASSFRLCLHDRDFLAGERITKNIVEGIATSRKVVIVLTPAYMKSRWCQFELDLALTQDRLNKEGCDDLIIILLEDVPKKRQTDQIRYLIRTRTYLAWACDIHGQKLFWQRLRKVLLHQ